MRALYKIEIDLLLDECMVGQVLERARNVYRDTGGAIQKNGGRDVIVSPEEFIEGPDDALLELVDESVRSGLPEVELCALRCKLEIQPSVGTSVGPSAKAPVELRD
jgi:hypothetical protein